MTRARKSYRGRCALIASGLGIAFLGFIAFAAVSWQAAVTRVAPQRAAVGPPPGDFRYSISSVSFTTADGILLKGWYAPGPDGRPAIVLLHPYDADRRAMLGRARLFRGAGYGVLLYDARGCGESGGDRRSVGYYEAADLLAALDFLKARGVTRTAVVGWSQGGATIMMAAQRLRGVEAAILESAFDTAEHSIDRAFRRRVHLPGWLAGMLYTPFSEHLLGFAMEKFRPIDHIAHLPCPVFVISGTEDRSTWAADTREIFAAARAPKQLWLIPGAAHQDLYAFTPGEYRQRVLAFLSRYLG